MTSNEALVEALKSDYRQAPLSSQDRAMLDYATKLTLTPWSMTREDIDTLRQVELDDTAILDLNQVTGYYAFVNRLADGLGVELEEFWGEDSARV